MFTAAILCFPSRWRLHEKLGQPLVEVHGPVPFYAERLATPVDRFMAKVKPGHIASRLNWSVLDDPAMYQPTGKWREAANAAITPGNAGDTLYLRVERQTLRRLPQSDAILFGIRVHSYPMARAITHANGGCAACRGGAGAAGGDRALQEPQGVRRPRCSPGWTRALAEQPVAERRDLRLFGGGARAHQPIGKLLRPGDIQHAHKVAAGPVPAAGQRLGHQCDRPDRTPRRGSAASDRRS